MSYHSYTLFLIIMLSLVGCSTLHTAPSPAAEHGNQEVSMNVPATLQPSATMPASNTSIPTIRPSSTPTASPRPPGWPTSTFAIRPSATTPPQLPTVPVPTTFPPPPLAGTIYTLRNGSLIAVDLETYQVRELGIRVHDAAPTSAWGSARYANAFQVAPDGHTIAFARDGALNMVSTQGGISRTIATSVTGDLAWTPDSSALAYVRVYEEDDYPFPCNASSEVWVFERSTGESRLIERGCHPAWAPDNQRLAYIGSTEANSFTSALYLISRRGQNRWRIFESKQGTSTYGESREWLSSPFWSPDGAYVYIKSVVRIECALTGVDTIEQANSYSGEVSTISVIYDLAAVYPNPTGLYVGLLTGGGIGIPRVDIARLLGKEHIHQANFCVSQDVPVRTESVGGSAWNVYDAEWSPDGRWLAVIYCGNKAVKEKGVGPSDYSGDCLQKRSIAEIRLLGIEEAGLSDVVIDNVDTNGVVQWLPAMKNQQ